MSSYGKLENFSLASLYSPRNKLALYVYDRSREAFRRAERRRARVKTADDFYKYQQQNRANLMKALGDIPYDKSLPLNAKVVGSFVYMDVTVEKIIFESRPGVFVTANLYLPNNRDGKVPVVLFQSGHAPLGQAHESYRRVCTTIAGEGIAVFSIDPIGQGERCTLAEPSPVKEHQYFGNRTWLNGESLTKYFVADAMRALDYIESRPELDSTRIGATGSSGGGTMTSLIAALDDRIKAAAPGTFITDRETYLYADSPQDAEQIWYGATADLFDHAELVACMCPKPYMLLVVDSDFFCVEGSERTYAEAKRFYDMLGAGDNLEMTLDASTHLYTPALAEAAAKFFVKAFFGEDRQVSVKLPPEAELLAVLDGKSVFTLEGAVTAEEENLKKYKSTRRLSASAAKKLLEKAVFGPRTECDPHVRHVFKASDADYDAEMIFWFSQPRMPDQGVLITPKGRDAKKTPVTVCLWQDGSNAIDAHAEEISRILASGRSAFVVDLVGVGKCTCDRISPAKGSFAYDARVKHNADLMFLGDSYGALFAYELCKAIDMLSSEYGATDIALYAEGTYSIYGDVLKRMDYGVSVEYANRVTAEELMRSTEPDTSAFMDVMFYGIARLLK